MSTYLNIVKLSSETHSPECSAHVNQLRPSSLYEYMDRLVSWLVMCDYNDLVQLRSDAGTLAYVYFKILTKSM